MYEQENHGSNFEQIKMALLIYTRKTNATALKEIYKRDKCTYDRKGDKSTYDQESDESTYEQGR